MITGGNLTPQAARNDPESTIQEHRRHPALPNDVREYLDYHKASLSRYYYGVRRERSDFFTTTFLEAALDDSSHALVYAIVAFSCYHYMFRANDGCVSLETFLEYYNKSIQLLRESMAQTKPGIATLLTVLQFATIEVRFSMFRIVSRMY